MSEQSNRRLIGNILKSIRIERGIPIKSIATNMNVSESTISQFETGKNKPTNERISVFTKLCGHTFNFDLDRNGIIDSVYDIYDLYTNLQKEELNETIQKIKRFHNIAYSYARFDYFLILYMDSIINQKDVDTDFYKKVIEIGKGSLSTKELSIYYDICALEEMYLNETRKALKYLNKATYYNNNVLMINYHYCSIYLSLGYFNLAQKYIQKSIEMAIQNLSFERLCYLLLNQGVLYMYTARYDEANALYYKLLKESKKRNNATMQYCVLSNLVFLSLIQKDIQKGFQYLEEIPEKFMDDLDLVLYKCLLHFFDGDYIESKNCIKKALEESQDSKYHKHFFIALKYVMDNKSEKAIISLEKCYQITIKYGENDRAIFILKALNELYLEHGLQEKLKRLKEVQEIFYKMSYADKEIENLDIKLN